MLDPHKQLEIIRDPSIILETADAIAARDALERGRITGKDVLNVCK